MPMEFFYSILSISLALTGNFFSLKSNFLAKSLSSFIIVAGLRSSVYKNLTKQHLKHSLSPILGTLINRFLGWSNSFGNLI